MPEGPNNKIAPVRYGDVVGQEQIVAKLKAFGEFYASNGSTPGHILITGADGMGQRVIASAFCNGSELIFSRLMLPSSKRRATLPPFSPTFAISSFCSSEIFTPCESLC